MLPTSFFQRHCNRSNVSTNHRSNTPQTIRISSSIAPPSIRMVWVSNSQRLPLAVQLNHGLGWAAKNHWCDRWWFQAIAAASGPQRLASSMQIHNNPSAVLGWRGLGVECHHRSVVLTMLDLGQNSPDLSMLRLGCWHGKTPLPSLHPSANILNNQLLIAGVAARGFRQQTIHIWGRWCCTNRWHISNLRWVLRLENRQIKSAGLSRIYLRWGWGCGKGLRRQLKQQWLHRIGVASKATPFRLFDLQINIIMNKYIYATTSRNINTKV
jgi:hypothetical protein